jgi:hypothetical protein
MINSPGIGLINVMLAEPYDRVVFDRTWQAGGVIRAGMAQGAETLSPFLVGDRRRERCFCRGCPIDPGSCAAARVAAVATEGPAGLRPGVPPESGYTRYVLSLFSRSPQR